MKIAYFGLPLGALLLASEGHDLGLVVLAKVAAPGRRRLHRVLGERPIIDCISRVADSVIETRLQALAPDALLSWFWTRKLPPTWLATARRGGFGVHPSLLPRHRGPDPYFAAIDAGDERTGATLHRLTEDYDTGDIILTESIEVGERNSWQLARAVDRPSLRLLRDGAARLRAGEVLTGTPQDETFASWAGEPEGEQLRVQWRWPTARILRRVRALAPTPGLRLSIRRLDFVLLRATRADPQSLALEPGEAAVLDDRVSIRTGDGAIALETVELAETGCTIGQSELARQLSQRGASASYPGT